MSSRTIWKYIIEPLLMGPIILKLPQGAQLLYAVGQHEQIVVYAVVPATEEREVWLFWVHGTGHPVTAPETALPLGVVSLRGGLLMFHVFAALSEYEQGRAS